MEQTIQRQGGRVKFSHEGYIYRFDKESKTQAGVKFWRCHEDGGVLASYCANILN